MSWKHDHYEWYYILIFGVIFGVAMSFAFDSFIMAIPVGFIFGLSIAMALGEKHSAKIDGDKLVFGVGKKVESVPLSEVESLEVDESNGEMVVRTSDGSTETLDPGWDKKGLAKFVAEVKREYQL